MHIFYNNRETSTLQQSLCGINFLRGHLLASCLFIFTLIIFFIIFFFNQFRVLEM